MKKTYQVNNEVNIQNKTLEDLNKAEQWIKGNISDKVNEADLPSETEIDNANEISPDYKHKVKKALWKKKLELTPIDTFSGKIKKHLMENIYKWKNWEYLDNIKGGVEDGEDSWLLTEMFNLSFGKTVAKEMLPKIETAIGTNTIEGYKKLDEEWGENKVSKEGGIEFNADRDYLGVWYTLRDYLKEATKNDESDKYNKLKTKIIKKEGEVFWNELETQIVNHKN